MSSLTSSETTQGSLETTNKEPLTSELQVTIVVVPRERFQFARESLESLYENTEFPFKLVYVDNHSPAKLRRYLKPKHRQRDFN